MAPPSNASVGLCTRCIPHLRKPRATTAPSSTLRCAMRRHAITALAFLTATAVTAPAAGAATLTTDRDCYQETQEIVVGGTGFAPSSVVTITRSGTVSLAGDGRRWRVSQQDRHARAARERARA